MLPESSNLYFFNSLYQQCNDLKLKIQVFVLEKLQ
jgi:hypothetical protein